MDVFCVLQFSGLEISLMHNEGAWDGWTSILSKSECYSQFKFRKERLLDGWSKEE